WTRQGPGHVVMPRRVAEEMAQFPWADRLEEVLSNVDLAGGRHEKPLVLFRTRGHPAPERDDRTPEVAPGPRRPDQPGAAGAEGRRPPRGRRRRLVGGTGRAGPRLRDPPGGRRQRRRHGPPGGWPGGALPAAEAARPHPPPRLRRRPPHRPADCPLPPH